MSVGALARQVYAGEQVGRVECRRANERRVSDLDTGVGMGRCINLGTQRTAGSRKGTFLYADWRAGRVWIVSARRRVRFSGIIIRRKLKHGMTLPAERRRSKEEEWACHGK